LEIENYGRPVALMAIDEEQQHGEFIALETLNAECRRASQRDVVPELD
jgi:hypothetical protein